MPVSTVPLPVSMNASSARPISACPPIMTSPGSTPQRSVHSGRRTSGSRSPSSDLGDVRRERGAARLEAARHALEVVGDAAPDEVLEPWVLLQLVDHRRARLQERFPQ